MGENSWNAIAYIERNGSVLTGCRRGELYYNKDYCDSCPLLKDGRCNLTVVDRTTMPQDDGDVRGLWNQIKRDEEILLSRKGYY